MPGDILSAPLVSKQEQELYRWEALSRPYRPLDRQLFSVGVVIAILVSIISALAGQWMIIVVLAAVIFAYYVWSTIPPEKTTFSITTWGVRAFDQLYKWDGLTKWWIDGLMGHKMLVIDAPGTQHKRLHLVINDSNEVEIRKVMEQYLVMDQPSPTPIDKASKWLAEKFPLTTR